MVFLDTTDDEAFALGEFEFDFGLGGAAHLHLRSRHWRRLLQFSERKHVLVEGDHCLVGRFFQSLAVQQCDGLRNLPREVFRGGLAHAHVELDSLVDTHEQLVKLRVKGGFCVDGTDLRG